MSSIEPPRVAVLLAAYEGEHWLVEQLDSILSQTHTSVTIFVSVDPSSDRTELVLREAAARDARIVVLPTHGRSGGAARNFFRLFRDVDFTAFDYVSLSDQDDIWFSDKLRRAHEKLREGSGDAYSSNVIAFWPNETKRIVDKAQPQLRWDYLFEAAGPGCTYVLKVDLARRFQKLVLRQWEQVQGVGLHDWLLYAFVRAQGYRWIIDPRPGMLYRQHANNQVGVNAGYKAFWHRVRKVLNGWAIDQAAIIAGLVGADRDPIVHNWFHGGALGLLALACRANECRRRRRDRLWFFCSCILSASRMQVRSPHS